MIEKNDCEDFGVCTKDDFFQDNKSLVLHLRIHSKPVAAKGATHPVEDSSLTQLPQNETYHELMKYTPALHNVPVAYENDNTDSFPFMLRESVDDARTSIDTVETALSSATPHLPTTGGGPDDAVDQPIGDATCTFVQPDTESKWYCWWCTHAFNHEPHSMPIRVDKKQTYETVGQFCSPECCAAYIFDSKNKYSDPWKQYEMLHQMILAADQYSDVHIKLAPPRETLQRFGGPYSIVEYRKIVSDYRKDVHLCTSPIRPVQRNYEEISVDFTVKKHKFLPIDTSRVKRAETELSLKRKKKKNTDNTLETFMRLRITEQN